MAVDRSPPPQAILKVALTTTGFLSKISVLPPALRARDGTSHTIHSAGTALRLQPGELNLGTHRCQIRDPCLLWAGPSARSLCRPEAHRYLEAIQIPFHITHWRDVSKFIENTKERLLETSMLVAVVDDRHHSCSLETIRS